MPEDHEGPDRHRRADRVPASESQPGAAAELLAPGTQPAPPTAAPGIPPSPDGNRALPEAYLPALLADPRLHGRGNGPVKAAVVQQAQQMYGNRAVQRFVHEGAGRAFGIGSGSSASPPIQRNGGNDAREADRESEEGEPLPPSDYTRDSAYIDNFFYAYYDVLTGAFQLQDTSNQLFSLPFEPILARVTRDAGTVLPNTPTIATFRRLNGRIYPSNLNERTAPRLVAVVRRIARDRVSRMTEIRQTLDLLDWVNVASSIFTGIVRLNLSARGTARVNPRSSEAASGEVHPSEPAPPASSAEDGAAGRSAAQGADSRAAVPPANTSQMQPAEEAAQNVPRGSATPHGWEPTELGAEARAGSNGRGWPGGGGRRLRDHEPASMAGRRRGDPASGYEGGRPRPIRPRTRGRGSEDPPADELHEGEGHGRPHDPRGMQPPGTTSIHPEIERWVRRWLERMVREGGLRNTVDPEEVAREFMDWLIDRHRHVSRHEHLSPGSPRAIQTIEDFIAEIHPGLRMPGNN